MDNKIITDDILQKAIQDTIQIIADNIFEFESYSDESIAELFDLTSEEAEKVSQLINDEVISKYKIWSSYGTNEVIKSAVSEANDYTDNRLSNLASISLKYCTALPTMGESNCIYILKSTNSNPDTLNLYDVDNASWVSIGSFDVSLDDYYTKTEIDTALVLKADKIEILAQDDVIVDTSLATTSNVLSATTTVNELDKKFDKDNLVTTYSANVTDEQVFSAKVVHSEFSKGFNGILTQSMTSVTDMDNLTRLGQHEVVWDTTNISNFPPVSKGITRMRIKIENISTSMYRQEIEFHAGIVSQGIWYRNLVDGAWSSWRKVATSFVEDVSLTSIELNETNLGFSLVTSKCNYEVINGICYVTMEFSLVAPSEDKTYGYTTINTTTLPKIGFSIKPVLNIVEANAPISVVLDKNTTLLKLYGTIPAKESTIYLIQGSFSYPVAES